MHQVLWALGKLRYRPSRQWATSLKSRVQSLLGALRPQGLTSIMHAMAWMEIVPSRKLLKVRAKVVVTQLPSCEDMEGGSY